MKIQVLCIELQINFSLMQPLSHISKKLYQKSTPCNNLSTGLRQQNKPYRYPPCCEVRNSIINIHLPLIILIRMHRMESQFHNKCFICLIKSIIYVQIPPFCLRVQNTIQRRRQVQAKFQTKSHYSSQKHVKRCIESIFRMFLT